MKLTALCFPQIPDTGGHFSGLIWAFLLVSAAIVIAIPSQVAIKCLVLSTILRFIVSVGPEFTLTLLGVAIVSKKSQFFAA